MKRPLSELQRILIVMKFYEKRGCNKESVNSLYKIILDKKFKKKEDVE